MDVKKFITGRVKYDNEGQYFWIVDEKDGHQMLAELRGWGGIQNMFTEIDGKINLHKAARFQDYVGKFIQDAINEKLERESK